MPFRCEEFVNDYLPSVKATIVKELHDEYDLNQIEISSVFDITQPAVSQYLRGLRGGDELPERIQSASKEAATEIYELHQNDDATDENINEILCSVCKKI